jgi:hypothetical protein
MPSSPAMNSESIPATPARLWKPLSGPPAPVKKPVVAAPPWNQPAGAGSGVAPAEELVGDASDLTNRGDGVRVDRHAPVRTATSEPAHSTSLLVDDPVVSAFALVARRVKSRSMVVGLVTDDRPVVLGAIVSGTLGYGIALRLPRVGTYAERVEQDLHCGRPARVRRPRAVPTRNAEGRSGQQQGLDELGVRPGQRACAAGSPGAPVELLAEGCRGTGQDRTCCPGCRGAGWEPPASDAVGPGPATGWAGLWQTRSASSVAPDPR